MPGVGLGERLDHHLAQLTDGVQHPVTVQDEAGVEGYAATLIRALPNGPLTSLGVRELSVHLGLFSVPKE
jgi:hypothetical protein